MRVVSVFGVLGVLLVTTSCGDGGETEDVVGQEPGPPQGEVVSIPGTVQVGPAVSGDLVPIVGHRDRPSAVWTFDAGSGRLEELPPPTDEWLIDPSIAATDDWVVISAGTCPEQPPETDVGLVCGTDAPDAVFAYRTQTRTWSRGDIPRRLEAGIGQVVSITESTATVAHRRSFDDASVELSPIALDAERLEVGAPTGVVVAQCASTQPPAVSFSDPEYRRASVAAPDGSTARTVELSDGAVPLVNTVGSPEPSCDSARDLVLLPGDADPSAPGFRYRVFRLDDRPVEVLSGQGSVTGLVAGADWFAVTDDVAIRVYDREGSLLREVGTERAARPVATEAGMVLLGARGDETTLSVVAVR